MDLNEILGQSITKTLSSVDQAGLRRFKKCNGLVLMGLILLGTTFHARRVGANDDVNDHVDAETAGKDGLSPGYTTHPPTKVLLNAGPGNNGTPGWSDRLVDDEATDHKLHSLVQQALTESPLIDGHNDLPWNLRKFLHGQLQEFDFNSDLKSTLPWSKSAWSHTDLPRLRKGLVGAQFWVAYAPCQAQHLNAVQITLEQIDLIRRLVAKYPDYLTLALSVDDIERAHKEGKIASLIAVEGGHSIGNSLATLRAFYEVGVRYLTLTHNCNTPWADSSLVETKGHKPQHGGLTGFGRTVVKEMNRLGMLVDLSHTSKMTMKDALKVSRAPVIFSHSSAYALCNSSRNVGNDILQELWLMNIVYYEFARGQLEHINFIRGRIGIDHIGIGGDFDGINRDQLNGVKVKVRDGVKVGFLQASATGIPSCSSYETVSATTNAYSYTILPF